MAWLDALRLLRPRTIAAIARTADDASARTVSNAADLKALSKDTSVALKELTRQVQQMGAHLDARLDTLADELRQARVKESQLRAVMRRDLEQTGLDAEFAGRAHDLEGIARHVRAAVDAALFRDDPFPHAVVDDVLPSWLYEALLAGLPPVELYADREVNRQQLTVPFALAPKFGHTVWRFMAQTVVDDALRPALMARFAPPLRRFLRETFPAADPGLVQDVPVQSSDGRIIFRRRGYHIRPHRDPKWGMITGILYLAKPGDDPRWGTDLFTVEGDTPAPSLAPHWFREEQCRHVGKVENRPNRLLVFLNSTGAHGATIPPELADAEVERSIYQFRLSPRSSAMRSLIATLPPEEQRSWQGKISDY